MSYITIHKPGIFTTVQDGGRYGYQRFGMPVAGAMDLYSMQLANRLVGNRLNCACLEATLTGPEIVFHIPGAIAVCGADIGPCINGKPVPGYRTIEIKKGDQLSFSGLRSGCRAYIAFAGGLDVPTMMNSRSTYLRAKIGGVEGRAIKAGDEIPLGTIVQKIKKKTIPASLIPEYCSGQTVRIIPGPEVKFFSLEGIRNFLTSEYQVTEQSDRMGYRLKGTAVQHLEQGADIVSSGISMGTIQVPGNGQPMILMADRQTTGGYTRIANVVTVDFTLLAQLKPGDTIRFQEISLDRAQELLSKRTKLVMAMGG